MASKMALQNTLVTQAAAGCHDVAAPKTTYNTYNTYGGQSAYCTQTNATKTCTRWTHTL